MSVRKRSEQPLSGVTAPTSPGYIGSDPRRRFAVEYKLRILEQADACKGKPGAFGELLRKDGLRLSARCNGEFVP